MYTKILVPLDGSRLAEQILPYASLLAQAFAIPVELLRVDDSGSLGAWKGNDYLKEIGNWAFPDSVQFHHSVEIANPTEAILRHAAADPKTLIAMSTRGLSLIHKWVMGSVAYKVVHAAINPVLLIRPTDGGDPGIAVQFRTVLVPLDGSGLSDQILPHVVALAKKLDLEVTLIRAYTSPPDGYLIGDGLYPDALASQESICRKVVEEFLTGKAEEMRAAGLTRLSPVATRGDPAEEIIGFARNTRNSLVTMSTHGRSGLERWLMGSVAEKVVQDSQNPVLVIRPERAPQRYMDATAPAAGARADLRAG